jgi:hypothetical protein
MSSLDYKKGKGAFHAAKYSPGPSELLNMFNHSWYLAAHSKKQQLQ